LNRRHDADVATIRAMRSGTTIPSLSEDRLQKLFTVHGIRLGKLTGGDRSDPKSATDDALKVYVVPFDEAGDALKAAGRFTVEAFDLAKPQSQKIGTWTFDTDQARKSWFG